MGARGGIALTEVEFKNLIPNIYKKDSKLGLLFEFLGYTGLRASEYIQVSRQWNIKRTKWISFTPLKNGEARRIHWPKSIDITQELPEFTNYRQLERFFKTINNVCGEELKALHREGLILHDMRNTFCTMVCNKCSNPMQAVGVTGHKKVDTLMMYYKKDPNTIAEIYESLHDKPYSIADSKQAILNQLKIVQRESRLKDGEIKHLERQLKEMKKEA